MSGTRLISATPGMFAYHSRSNSLLEARPIPRIKASTYAIWMLRPIRPIMNACTGTMAISMKAMIAIALQLNGFEKRAQEPRC